MINDIDLARQCKNELAKHDGTPRVFVIGHIRWQRIVDVWQELAPILGHDSNSIPTELHGLAVEVDQVDPERLTCKV